MRTIHEDRPTTAVRPAPAGSGRGSGGVIVVGVDGTPAAAAAARWAAHEADRVGAGLLLVHGYQLPPAGYTLPDLDVLPSVRIIARKILDEAAAGVRAVWPQLTVSTLLEQADPVAMLRAESAAARLTVLGADTGHRVRNALLGSVAHDVAAGGAGPVVLVHSDDDYRTTGPVVVGVDGTRASVSAALFAVDLAADAGADVVVVHGTDSATTGPTVDAGILEILERCALRQPMVEVRQVVRTGRPTDLLLAAAAGARLVVLGTRGRGGITGLLLGSTGHEVIARAGIAVAVVPPGSVV